MKIKKIINKIHKYISNIVAIKCDECGGTLHDIDIYIDKFYNQHTIYECDKCHKKFITL